MEAYEERVDKAIKTTIGASGRPPKKRIANPDLGRKIWIDRRTAPHGDPGTHERSLPRLFVNRPTGFRKAQTEPAQATQEPTPSSMNRRRTHE